MTADRLRRAAAHLRSPYLCNWSTDVALALTAALETAAHRADYLAGSIPLIALDRHMADVAEALLRSFGHTCVDKPDEPCETCALMIPTPERTETLL